MIKKVLQAVMMILMAVTFVLLIFIGFIESPILEAITIGLAGANLILYIGYLLTYESLIFRPISDPSPAMDLLDKKK